MRRRSVRAMRPDAYDPWQHNRDQATLRAMRRLARSARHASRALSRLGGRFQEFALVLRRWAA